MSERKSQNEVRNALAGKVLCFRANVGQAWTGDAQRLPDGSILIRNPRPFTTGLPPGFSDLFGQKKEVITPAMVGQTFGRFFALEMKDERGRVSEKQAAFLQAIKANGGLAGVARSVNDALEVLGLKE